MICYFLMSSSWHTYSLRNNFKLNLHNELILNSVYKEKRLWKLVTSKYSLKIYALVGCIFHQSNGTRFNSKSFDSDTSNKIKFLVVYKKMYLGRIFIEVEEKLTSFNIFGIQGIAAYFCKIKIRHVENSNSKDWF